MVRRLKLLSSVSVFENLAAWFHRPLSVFDTYPAPATILVLFWIILVVCGPEPESFK